MWDVIKQYVERKEPVVSLTVYAPLAVSVASYYGFEMSLVEAAAMLGGLSTAGGVLARRYVSPVKKAAA